MGGRAIPSGPSDFLGVIFEGFGEVVVIDGPDVCFVDAHAEGDGSANDRGFPGHELLLDFGAYFRSQTSMVGAGGKAVFVEETREGFRAKLQGGVDDGGLVRRVFESFKKVIPAVGICERGDRKLEVGSVKGQLMVIVRGDLEVVANVFRNLRCRCCREAENPLNPKLLGEAGEFEVVGPEVMSPFRNAVCFIDGKKRDGEFFQTMAKFLIGETFGCDIEKFNLI